jgi:hypothetical protein
MYWHYMGHTHTSQWTKAITKKYTVTPHPHPTIKTVATTDVETGRNPRGGHPLGEDVDEVGSNWDFDTNVSDDNTLANKVEININMLDALMLYEINGEVDGP